MSGINKINAAVFFLENFSLYLERTYFSSIWSSIF